MASLQQKKRANTHTAESLGPWPPGFGVKAHIPIGADGNTPLLVAVHGISRNADEHFRTFRKVLPPEVALVCPEFSEAEFKHYQRLNIGYDEPRADLLLDALLERLAQRYRMDTRRFHLFGFSGGAQFAHRYAMLNRPRIHSLHVAAAGYYTFLDPDVSWPRGCRGATGGRILALAQHFLRLPVHVYVGEQDTVRDCNLRSGERVDRQQGETRVDRARNWTNDLNRRKVEGGAAVSLTVLPACGHDFTESAAAGDDLLVKQIANSILGHGAKAGELA
jgi:predicted esterase